MAFSYKPHSLEMRDFAAFAVKNVPARCRAALQAGLEIYGEHRWDAWSLVVDQISPK